MTDLPVLPTMPSFCPGAIEKLKSRSTGVPCSTLTAGLENFRPRDFLDSLISRRHMIKLINPLATSEHNNRYPASDMGKQLITDGPRQHR